MNNSTVLEKFDINLLQAELLPKRPTVTLSRVVGLSIFFLLLMLTWAFWSHQQLAMVTAQVQQLSAEEAKKNNKLSALQEQLNTKRQDNTLLEKLAALKILMQNKQVLHGKLTDPQQTYVAGFAEAMTELSNHHHSSISLTNVKIGQDNLYFSGIAKSADAVPEWLAGFERSVFLSGKHFKHFKLTENEQKVTSFIISSTSEVDVSNEVSE